MLCSSRDLLQTNDVCVQNLQNLDKLPQRRWGKGLSAPLAPRLPGLGPVSVSQCCPIHELLNELNKIFKLVCWIFTYRFVAVDESEGDFQWPWGHREIQVLVPVIKELFEFCLCQPFWGPSQIWAPDLDWLTVGCKRALACVSPQSPCGGVCWLSSVTLGDCWYTPKAFSCPIHSTISLVSTDPLSQLLMSLE